MTPGIPCVHRASAVTPTDPKARWRGVIVTAGAWPLVRWTTTTGEVVERHEDATILAYPASVAANDRHHHGPAWWPATQP